MDCASLENPWMDFAALVRSVSNPPAQPIQQIPVETAPRNDGGQVGGPGSANGGGRGGGSQPTGGASQGQVGAGAASSGMEVRVGHMVFVSVISVLGVMVSW